jgi:hypothetical protein
VIQVRLQVAFGVAEDPGGTDDGANLGQRGLEVLARHAGRQVFGHRHLLVAGKPAFLR